MIESDRARIDRPGKSKAKVFTVDQRTAESMLPKNALRIVLRPEQRSAKLPPAVSASDIRKAMAVYAGRTDPNSAAIARGLKALLAAQQGGASG